ncbi:MAG: NAD(P)-dependent glycerol-3-phosphate dehydrogenase, partial [Candidatus Omnitrophica bacterium]|nr:NAD(P)-dependent glycerol-3-phosphate dehydrogenase [Candidatus Omnitrophota bacterium]
LWTEYSENIQNIQSTGYNQKFLPGITIPREIRLTSSFEEAFQAAELMILAVPSQFVVDVLKKSKKLYPTKVPMLSLVKGIDTKTLKRMSEVIEEILGPIPLAVLSGPTIAMEVAKGVPSTAVIASRNRVLANALQKVFNSETFRIYTNNDVIGLELGGSFKNVIAIACGVCDGLGYGTNTKAAILTRSLVEMSHLGKAMGAQSKTFFGLAGLGDLVTTCFSPQSRNRTVGEQVGRGKSLQEVSSSMDMIAEGVENAKAVYRLSRKYKVRMPISTEIYKVLHQGKLPQKAVADLMGRDSGAE